MSDKPHRHYLKIDLEVGRLPHAHKCASCQETIPAHEMSASGDYESCNQPGEKILVALCFDCFKHMSHIVTGKRRLEEA